jgi:hypothetical protein
VPLLIPSDNTLKILLPSALAVATPSTIGSTLTFNPEAATFFTKSAAGRACNPTGDITTASNCTT